MDNSACLVVQGMLIDNSTHQPLKGVRLFARTVNGRSSLGTSEGSGRFSVDIPCEATMLLIERIGYRSQQIPVKLPLGVTHRFMTVLIPMVPVDKQRSDTPYLQTEQTNYVQHDRSSSQSMTDSNQLQHNTFVVTDAIGNNPISATVCFFFTKSGINGVWERTQKDGSNLILKKGTSLHWKLMLLAISNTPET